MTWALPCKPGKEKVREKGERHGIQELKDLPVNWWTTVRNDPGGYQLITETLVFGIPVPTLLDTGAAVNTITEEMLVEIINSALQDGVKAQDPEYPVVQLERWQEKECVAGVAKDRPVKLIGAVVLRVVLGTAKARQGPQVLLRFKIFSKGACDWHGLIIGGRALDVPERGGLGLRVTQDAVRRTRYAPASFRRRPGTAERQRLRLSDADASSVCVRLGRRRRKMQPPWLG